MAFICTFYETLFPRANVLVAYIHQGMQRVNDDGVVNVVNVGVCGV